MRVGSYSRASDQAASYHVRLDRIQRFLVGNSAYKSLEADIKHTTHVELIKKLADIRIVDHK